jgi:hypothetical protein
MQSVSRVSSDSVPHRIGMNPTGLSASRGTATTKADTERSRVAFGLTPDTLAPRRICGANRAGVLDEAAC